MGKLQQAEYLMNLAAMDVEEAINPTDRGGALVEFFNRTREYDALRNEVRADFWRTVLAHIVGIGCALAFATSILYYIIQP